MSGQDLTSTTQGRGTDGRWLPGHSGNPKGPAPRRKITEGLWLELNRRNENGEKNLHLIIRRLVEIARDGDNRDALAAQKLLFDTFGVRLDADAVNGAKGGTVINVILPDNHAAPVVDISAEEVEE